MAKRKRSFPRRGSVYRVSLNPAVGQEIRKSRPALVVSNDHMNELSATVLIMPVTTGHFGYCHWIEVSPSEGGLTKPSSIVTEQIRSVDKQRLGRQLGMISEETMVRIEDAIHDHFGLS